MTTIRDAGILITGASRGIGEAAAVELAHRGARLALAARTKAQLDKLARDLRKEGAEVHVIVADMSQEDQVRAMVAQAEEQLGGIDVLVNNAGLGLSGPVQNIKPDDFRYVFEVNVVAPHVGTVAALPGMLKRKRGHIVNVGSVASHISVPKLGGYAATKFALKALSDALRMELQGTGVHVSLICPGPIKTDFVANVKGTRRGHLPEKPIGAPVSAAGRCIANAIAHNTAEAFVPAYYQGVVGANSLVPQMMRIFGRRGMQLSTDVVEKFG